MSNDNRNERHLPERVDCGRRRLAQGGVAAVDVCDCGTLQLHIGALSLRMDEGALSELVSTLGEALAKYALDPSPRFHGALPSFTRREPGEA